MKSLPNILTLIRILVIPIIISLLYIKNYESANIVAASLFAFACITDFFDGFLARQLQAQSNIGRFLDPIADKLLVSAIMLVLVDLGQINVIPALAIISREILVSGLREFLVEIQVLLPVSKLSKIKTFIQMSAVFVLLLSSQEREIPYIGLLGQALLWVAAILTVYTGAIYLKLGIAKMN